MDVIYASLTSDLANGGLPSNGIVPRIHAAISDGRQMHRTDRSQLEPVQQTSCVAACRSVSNSPGELMQPGMRIETRRRLSGH